MTDHRRDPGAGEQIREALERPHGHGGAHPPAELDVIPSRKVVFVGVAALVVFFVASLVAIGSMKREQRELLPQGPAPLPRELGTPKIGMLEQRLFENSNQATVMREVQHRKLATAGWVDPAQGIVRIPIDRAMELVQRGERPAPVAPPAQGTTPAGGAARGLGDAPGRNEGGGR